MKEKKTAVVTTCSAEEKISGRSGHSQPNFLVLFASQNDTGESQQNGSRPQICELCFSLIAADSRSLLPSATCAVT